MVAGRHPTEEDWLLERLMIDHVRRCLAHLCQVTSHSLQYRASVNYSVPAKLDDEYRILLKCCDESVNDLLHLSSVSGDDQRSGLLRPAAPPDRKSTRLNSS